MQAHRSKNKRHANWVKVSLALLYLREGITTFSDEKARAFHKDIAERVRQKSTRAATVTCSRCTHKSAVKTKTQDKRNTTWRMHCNANVCSVWLEIILPYHRHLPLPNIAWANSNPQLWPSDVWEVMKLFQPYGVEKHRKAEDSDCAALLSMMFDCSFFHKFLANTAILQEIKDVRNACMHSCDLEIDDQAMRYGLGRMISLLEGPWLRNRQESIKAKLEIIQLRDNELDLSLNTKLELRALKHKIDELHADVDGLTAEHQRLKADLGDIMSRQDATVEDYTQQRDRLQEVVQQIATMTNNLETIQQTHDPSLRANVADLTSRLQDLERKSRESTNGGTFCAGQMEEEGEEAFVQSVQKTLIDIYETHCQRVPIYPLTPTRVRRVEDLYVKPKMVLEDPRGTHMHFEDRNKLQSGAGADEPTSQEQPFPIEQYKELFYSEGQLCKNIYVSADAGKGKTSLCEHLVNLWVSYQTKRSISTEDTFIAVFTFLFYVSLREANTTFKDCYRIDEIIKSQLQLKGVNVERLMKDYECLVIMDGLDELTQKRNTGSTRFRSLSLPEKPIEDRCVYLTTSRPFKLELLAPDLEGKIDRQINIEGLEVASQEELTNRVISLLNSERGKGKKAFDFMREVKRQSLVEYLETPILLMQMLGLWHDDIPLGNSQCTIYSNMIEKQIEFTEKTRQLPRIDQPSQSCQDQLPGCFADLRFCHKYRYLLFKVSILACDRLFDKKQQNILVFSHGETEICGLSNTEVHQLLHMGILTQNKVFGGVTEELKSISFVHKSHQEFFCALHLTRKGDTSDMHRLFTEVIYDLDRALELEKLFVFVCGMSSNAGVEMSGLIMERVSTNTMVQKYRGEFNDSFDTCSLLVKRIQKIIEAGVAEARRNCQLDAALEIHDIYVYKVFGKLVGEHIVNCNTIHSKSIVMSYIDTKTWPRSPCVIKIDMQTVNISSCIDFNVNFKAGQLSILRLESVKITHGQICHFFNVLSKATSLTEIRFRDVSWRVDKHRTRNLDILLDLSAHVHLKRLWLSEIRMDGCFRVVVSSKMETLSQVMMCNFSVSADALKTLFRSLPENGVEVKMWRMDVRGRWEKCLRAVRKMRVAEVIEDEVDYSGDHSSIRRYVFVKKREVNTTCTCT